MKGGIAPGDRVLFTGELGPRGAHGDVQKVGRKFAGVRFDDHGAMMTPNRDLHPIPRRPKPMW
ncbi:hypothetical protein [Sphingomonas sp. T9W2]|uniref:hypothetical protein n=1 Tax=Sphingomonas sp. T9W2 TaxID=3143183 RepID=UPI0031F553F8